MVQEVLWLSEGAVLVVAASSREVGILGSWRTPRWWGYFGAQGYGPLQEACGLCCRPQITCAADKNGMLSAEVQFQK